MMLLIPFQTQTCGHKRLPFENCNLCQALVSGRGHLGFRLHILAQEVYRKQHLLDVMQRTKVCVGCLEVQALLLLTILYSFFMNTDAIMTDYLFKVCLLPVVVKTGVI